MELPPADMAKLPVGPPITLSADALTVVPHRGMGEQRAGSGETAGTQRNARLALGVAGVAMLLLCLVLFLPYFLIPASGPTADARMQSVSAIRTSIVQLVGSMALISGLYFTLQNLRLSRRAFSASTTQQSIERFSRAVKCLGDKDRLEVRLGGIHVLRRMAEDSPEDQAVVSQIFCTLLREHRGNGDAARRGRAAPDVTAMASSLDRFNGLSAGLDPLDLSGANLSYLRLRALNLARADLADASLECARIDALDLTDANLIRLDGQGADLRRSSMVRAVARNANFDGADLSWSDLRSAAFILASLRNCSLVGCTLDGSLFVGADLRGAILRSADLSGTDLSGADLHGAKIDDQTRWPAGFDAKAAGVEPGT
ncbi:pentapeptide repeat-containing protein [Amycolatopsis sp. GA6-003]|uniref:pentapeptide repeat-containing protein n=1 Tax=Amycolatopsis sp. GA6-003 TaxID=2652444 RepID=UPI003916D3DB